MLLFILKFLAIHPEVFSAFHPHRSHLPVNLTRAHPPFFLSRSIMAAAHPHDTSGTQPTSGVNTSRQHTPQSTAPHTQSTQPFLPGNGPIHLAPSLTHQPEILLLHRLFDILFLLVTHILEHPMAGGPVPDTTMFVDHNAFCLFHQYHSRVVDLGRATMRLMRARRLALSATHYRFSRQITHHSTTVSCTISQPLKLSTLNNHYHLPRTFTLTGSIDILITQQISHHPWTSTTCIVKLIQV